MEPRDEDIKVVRCTHEDGGAITWHGNYTAKELAQKPWLSRKADPVIDLKAIRDEQRDA